jgi:hypothetical protein
MFTIAEGVNGKHSSKKSGPNPLRSTQSISFRTFGCLDKKVNILFCPYFLMSIKTKNAPKHAPSHEYKNPSQSPKAFALAITNKNNGRNGKNASMTISKIPGNGPKARYSCMRLKIFSSVSHAFNDSKSIRIPLHISLVGLNDVTG